MNAPVRLGFLVLFAACSCHHRAASRPSADAGTPSDAAADAASFSDATVIVQIDSGPPEPIQASVPVTICDSSYGVEIDADKEKHAAKTATLTMRSDLVGSVAMYMDRLGEMGVVGPRGWRCRSLRAANGALEMAIEPPDAPKFTGARPRGDGPSDALVYATVPSVCCADAEACRLIPRAARGYEVRMGMVIPHLCDAAPTAELVVWERGSATDTPTNRDTVVRFTDPPRVKGNGDGSGGSHSASGVMLYRPFPEINSASTRKLTCILSDEQNALCDALLSDFTERYGQRQ